MLRRTATWLVRRKQRRAERDVDRFTTALVSRTVRVFTHPIQTIVSTSFVVALVAVLYLVSQRPVATQALLDAESVGLLDVLALFPAVYVTIPALLALVVLVNAVRVWSGVRDDMGWHRRYRH